MEKVVDVKLAITIDDDLISKEDILRGIDEILKCSDGVHAWGEITKERNEILFLVAQDEKCGGCNWRVQNLYMMGETKKDAMEAYKENDRGLCGDCMCEMLSERNYQITKLGDPDEKRESSPP